MTKRTAPDDDSQLPRMLDSKGLARRWGLKEDTVRAWARRGLLPSIKVADKVLFLESDLLAFIQSKRGA